MNKRILISLSVIGVVAAIAIGGTVAYFSDTETSTGNTFTSGKLDLTLGRGTAATINASNLEPGKWVYNVASPIDPVGSNLFGPMNVRNLAPSTINFKYRFMSSFVSETVDEMWDLMWVRVYRAEGSSNRYVLKWEGLLKNMLIDPSLVSVMSNLSVGSSHDWRFDVKLDESAGNDYQGATGIFNIVVEATQTNNTGW